MSKVEKFIQEHTKNCSNKMESPLYANHKLNFYPWLIPDQARKAMEIAREEIYEWLQENAYKYSTVGIYTDAMITDLKQAIK